MMWYELTVAMYDRKVPIYGSYLFKLISTTWEAQVPDERLEADKLATHDVMKILDGGSMISQLPY